MNIKPIETHYNGCSFRSRIEARWAVFFDSVGIQYQYESEGYNIDGLLYLPDFWLPELDTFVEIKGDLINNVDELKVKKLSSATGKRVLVLSGSIPNPKRILDDCYDRQFDSFCMYFPDGVDSPYLFCECSYCGLVGIEFDGRSDRLPCKLNKKCVTSNHGDKGYNYDSKKIINGYGFARSYRF